MPPSISEDNAIIREDMSSQKRLNYDLAMAFAAGRLAKRTAAEIGEQAKLAECSTDEMELEMIREDFFNAYEYYRAQFPADENPSFDFD